MKFSGKVHKRSLKRRASVLNLAQFLSKMFKHVVQLVASFWNNSSDFVVLKNVIRILQILFFFLERTKGQPTFSALIRIIYNLILLWIFVDLCSFGYPQLNSYPFSSEKEKNSSQQLIFEWFQNSSNRRCFSFLLLFSPLVCSSYSFRSHIWHSSSPSRLYFLVRREKWEAEEGSERSQSELRVRYRRSLEHWISTPSGSEHRWVDPDVGARRRSKERIRS